jgi:hypothetical protein
MIVISVATQSWVIQLNPPPLTRFDVFTVLPDT